MKQLHAEVSTYSAHPSTRHYAAKPRARSGAGRRRPPRQARRHASITKIDPEVRPRPTH